MPRSLVLLLAACSGSPAPPSSSGAIEIDTLAERGERDVDVYLATQVEVLRSPRLLEQALEREHSGTSVASLRDRLEVARRGDSAVIDVRVRVAGDPEEAARLCNAVLEAYMDRRASLAPRTEDVEAPRDLGARVLDVCRVPLVGRGASQH